MDRFEAWVLENWDRFSREKTWRGDFIYEGYRVLGPKIKELYPDRTSRTTEIQIPRPSYTEAEFLDALSRDPQRRRWIKQKYAGSDLIPLSYFNDVSIEHYSNRFDLRLEDLIPERVSIHLILHKHHFIHLRMRERMRFLLSKHNSNFANILLNYLT